MPSVVLDASAVLALLRQERGWETVAAVIDGSAISAVNYSEVISKMVERGGHLERVVAEAEGRWPEYPLALLEIGRKNNLLVPGMSLPGPRELWDNARTALPDVPARVLFAFGQSELSPEAKANLLQVGDEAEQREILKQEYFKKYPHELQRLRRLDRRPPNLNKP